MIKIQKIISILIFVFPLSVYSQQTRFFSSDKDLSNSMVTSILQDRSGFIWIATEDGLNRFDGLNFSTYRNIPGDSTSLMSNFVRTLMVDQYDRLWIGLIDGLMIYDPNTDSFREIPLYRDTLRLKPHITSIIETKSGDILIATSGQGLIKVSKGSETGTVDLRLTTGLSSEFLESVFEDHYGRIWMGTENQGIDIFDPLYNEILHYRHQPGIRGAISSNFITSIAEDYRRNIYVGTVNGGVNRFNEEEKNFELVQTTGEENNDLPVKTIYADGKNNLWVGTIGKGLWRLNNAGRNLEQFSLTTTQLDLYKSKIHSITEDHEGNLWLGLFLKGVMMVPGKSNRFNTITYQQFGKKGIGSGCIMTVAEDKNQNIWVGTDTEGFYKINNHQSWEFTRYQLTAGKDEKLPSNITSIFFDKKGRMWIGTSLDGFFRFYPETGQSRQYKNNPYNENSLSNDKVQCIAEDMEGNLWIGTSGGGVNKYNPETGIFTRYVHNPFESNTICNNWVNTIFVDSEGLIWMGTFYRISVLDPKTETFRHISRSDGLLPNNVIFYFTEDSGGKIWIGTNDGLVCFDKNSNTSRFFTIDDGLANNVITAILEDDQNQLWISTHNGISCFSPDDETFKNYYVYDGLQGNEFRRNSALRNRNGELFFGGINGLTWFLPDQIIRDYSIPQVYLTNLHIFNKAVQIGEKFDKRVILERSIANTDTLLLNWQQKNFSVEFSTIGFVNPERITYQYRLRGFDEGWVHAGVDNRRATYTNLKPGKYLFEIRATDNDRSSTAKQLSVIITPPWWSTLWFRIIYISVIVLMIYAVYHHIRSRIRHRHELIKLEHQEKMNEAKLSFYTNFSHEIRTPLTLIAGPLEKLMAESKENRSLMKNFQIIWKNTHRLLRLVTQLLDVRKIERGQMLINYSQLDLVKFISDIMHAFDYLAEKKNINISFTTSKQRLPVWTDPDNFDKVLYNVLSNAFKFTPNNGFIEIHLRTGKDPDHQGFLKEYAEISISDTGIGIAPENLERIFDRFYQVKNDHNTDSGTGIGLHLSRSLVEMQHGSIHAENRTDQHGSIFIIRIPLGLNHIANAQITQPTGNNDEPAIFDKKIAYIDSTIETDEFLNLESKTRKKTGYKILVVDDDEQMRNYLRDELNTMYTVMDSPNGKDALDIVLNKTPDLVLTDVIMPVMDGVSLCRKLKSNPATSHLPVVILSSRSNDEHLIQALDVGADAYFVKPFQTDKLKKSIYNLLANRERVKIRYSPGGNINAQEKAYPSADQALMEKIMQIIENRISDPKLNAEDLSREIGMSRVHLFRRLKKITGQAPSDFIRKIRLQKAAQLLEGNTGFIKEIAFDVGFASLSYFSKCFHEFYGVKPSEYGKDNHDSDREGKSDVKEKSENENR
jgi:signal transduction histidine kinase/ligand-binding sensor domain-containing protein/DNA-binding response OmpR family regulator